MLLIATRCLLFMDVYLLFLKHVTPEMTDVLNLNVTSISHTTPTSTNFTTHNMRAMASSLILEEQNITDNTSVVLDVNITRSTLPSEVSSVQPTLSNIENIRPPTGRPTSVVAMTTFSRNTLENHTDYASNDTSENSSDSTMTSSSSKNGSKLILTELYYNLTHGETITYSDTPVSRPSTRPSITSSSPYPSESDKTTTDFISTIKLTEEEAGSTITGQNKNNSYDERKTLQFEEIKTTLIDATVTKTTNSLNIISTTEQKVESEDGYHINDVYVLLAISLVIITIWLLLAFFLYIIVCNRVSSGCSTHSSKSRGVYSNTAHVSVVVATEEGIFDDDGIEILRTAL